MLGYLWYPHTSWCKPPLFNICTSTALITHLTQQVCQQFISTSIVTFVSLLLKIEWCQSVGGGEERHPRTWTRGRPLPVYARKALWCSWTLACGQRGKCTLLLVQANLPPGIDQKQINFHFQLRIQLNPMRWGGEIVMFTSSSCSGRAWGNTRRNETLVFASLCLIHPTVKVVGWAVAAAATFYLPEAASSPRVRQNSRNREEGGQME